MSSGLALSSPHGRSNLEFRRVALGKALISAILLLTYGFYAYTGGHSADLQIASLMLSVPILTALLIALRGRDAEQVEQTLFYIRCYSLLVLIISVQWISEQTEAFKFRIVLLYASLYFAYVTDFLFIQKFRFLTFVALGTGGCFLLPTDLTTQLMLCFATLFMTAIGYDTVRLRENNSRLMRELTAASEDQIFRIAHYDSLTGLPNYQMLQSFSTQWAGRDDWDQRELAVFAIGLDGFKAVNDSLGHSAGDEILQKMAHRIAEHTEPGDILSRYSADQFTLIIPDYQSVNLLNLRARQLLWNVAQPIEIDQEQLMITCSIGVALHQGDRDLSTLIENAESAMNEAKLQGRNRYAYYDSAMVKATQDRLRVESALRLAIKEQNGFQLVYQPKLDLRTGQVSGAEALIRWHDPKLGYMRPDQFIDIAESTGLIVPLGYWIFNQALADFERLEESGVALPSLSINLSATQFQDPALLATLLATLNSYRLDPRKIDIELTESAMMTKPAEGLAILRELKAARMTLSIDDFGVAYSSLSYLKQLPADRLKIDRSFITEITDQKDDQLITASIIMMGHKLGLTVLAEGVETEEQLALLTELGCDELQGYLYSKPLPYEEFAEFLRFSPAPETRRSDAPRAEHKYPRA